MPERENTNKGEKTMTTEKPKTTEKKAPAFVIYEVSSTATARSTGTASVQPSSTVKETASTWSTTTALAKCSCHLPRKSLKQSQQPRERARKRLLSSFHKGK
jgi:hypothetical protein